MAAVDMEAARTAAAATGEGAMAAADTEVAMEVEGTAAGAAAIIERRAGGSAGPRFV